MNRFFADHWDYLVGTGIGVLGLLFSLLAFKEAAAAKRAANRAAFKVKLQSVILEMEELALRLDSVSTDNLSYSVARDLLVQLTRKVNRFTAPYREILEFSPKILEIEKRLEQTKDGLESMRPVTGAAEPDKRTVYYAVEGGLSRISALLSSLVGLMETHVVDHIDGK